MAKLPKSDPKIGIFWVCYENNAWHIFHSISYSINLGYTYGDFIIAGESHDPIWESLKRHQIIPEKSIYTDLPRGRVAYSTMDERYLVYAGKWIDKQIKQIIKSEFYLDSNTQWIADFHYDTFKKINLNFYNRRIKIYT